MTSPTKPAPQGGPTPAVVVNVPQQPAQPTTPKTTATRAKAPQWWRHPSALLCYALTLVLVELLLYLWIGPWWTLAVNVAVVLLFLVVVVAWKRGDAWRFLAGLFGRGGRSETRRTSSTTGTGTRRGPLGRLFGTGTPGGGTGRRRWPFGRKGTGTPGAGTGTGKRPGTGTRRGGTPGTGTPRGGTRRRWPFGGTGTPGRKRGTPGGGTGKGKGSKGTGTPGDRGGKTGHGGKDGGKDGKPGDGPLFPNLFGVARDNFKQGYDEQREANQQRKTKDAEPDRGAGTKDEGGAPVGAMNDQDMNLFKWGELLRTLPGVMDDTAAQAGKASERAHAIGQGLSNMAEQGVSELPADRGLASEVQAISTKFSQAAADVESATARMREAQNEAEALHGRYERDHETDLARLRGERAPRHVERKADVGTADE